jgi:hypothetical protein
MGLSVTVRQYALSDTKADFYIQFNEMSLPSPLNSYVAVNVTAQLKPKNPGYSFVFQQNYDPYQRTVKLRSALQT